MTYPQKTRLAVAALTAGAAFMAVSLATPAEAQRRSEPKREDFSLPLSRVPGPPVLAVVSLGGQHVTIYDTEGKILRAPISSGQTGYETPAGIFSILEKNREHYSNLYDDAEMPFMQRITWSGIALHAGVLPGRPASHGCIRMPYRFAEQLFDLTKTGLRVVIVRDDMTPVDFAHPALFKPGPIRSEVVLASAVRPHRHRYPADAPRHGTDRPGRHARADLAGDRRRQGACGGGCGAKSRRRPGRRPRGPPRIPRATSEASASPRAPCVAPKRN